MIKLNIEKRDATISNEKLREMGKIPAVFYGPKEDSTPISVDSIEFMKVYNEAGTSSIITLHMGDEDNDALIHDVQFHAVSSKPLHVDFYVIERGKKLTLHVPIEFIGEAPAEKLGGILVKVLHEVEIEAMPRNLPPHLDVDISVLVDNESIIHAKDIVLPEGVELQTDPEETIILVQAPKEEEAEEVVFDPEAVKVEEKGKKEEDKEEK